jgi:hypothetical protein
MDIKIFQLCKHQNLRHDTISQNTSEKILFQKSLAIRNLTASPTPLESFDFRPLSWEKPPMAPHIFHADKFRPLQLQETYG